MFLRLVDELAEKENVTEALKADNAMEWVRKIADTNRTIAKIDSCGKGMREAGQKIGDILVSYMLVLQFRYGCYWEEENEYIC